MLSTALSCVLLAPHSLSRACSPCARLLLASLVSPLASIRGDPPAVAVVDLGAVLLVVTCLRYDFERSPSSPPSRRAPIPRAWAAWRLRCALASASGRRLSANTARTSPNSRVGIPLVGQPRFARCRSLSPCMHTRTHAQQQQQRTRAHVRDSPAGASVREYRYTIGANFVSPCV